MKGLGNILALIGVVLVIYAIIGRFLGSPTIGLGLVKMSAQAGLIMANSLMLIAIVLKLLSK